MNWIGCENMGASSGSEPEQRHRIDREIPVYQLSSFISDTGLNQRQKRTNEHQSSTSDRRRCEASLPDQFVELCSPQARRFACLGDGTGKALREWDRGRLQNIRNSRSSNITIPLTVSHGHPLQPETGVTALRPAELISQRRLLGTLASGRESARTKREAQDTMGRTNFSKVFFRYLDFGFARRLDRGICAPYSQPSMTPSAPRFGRCKEGRDGETATSGRTKKRPRALPTRTLMRLRLFAANNNIAAVRR